MREMEDRRITLMERMRRSVGHRPSIFSHRARTEKDLDAHRSMGSVETGAKPEQERDRFGEAGEVVDLNDSDATTTSGRSSHSSPSSIPSPSSANRLKRVTKRRWTKVRAKPAKAASSVRGNAHFLRGVLIPRMARSVRARCQTFSFASILNLFPGVTMLGGMVSSGIKSRSSPTEGSSSGKYLNDIVVGICVGSMSISQGMSYALLAGLPPQVGLYNQIFQPITYFLLGSCPQVAVGVSAIESILFGKSLNKIITDVTQASKMYPGQTNIDPEPDPALRVQNLTNLTSVYCLALALIFILFRILKLTVLAELLADPVLSGFGTASAFLVGASQIKHAFRMPEIKSDFSFVQTIGYVFNHLSSIHVASLLTALICLVFLTICKRLTRLFELSFPIPGPLLLVFFACLISWAADLNGKFGISIVGNIPRGLGAIGSTPKFNWRSQHQLNAEGLIIPSIWKILPDALRLAAIFFTIHVSIFKLLARRTGTIVKAKQEAWAYSGMQIISCFTGCYSANTSLSRSSLTAALGVSSSLHSLSSGLMVLIAVFSLTKPLAYLPMATLAAVVLFGVVNMVEFDNMRNLLRLQKVMIAASGSGGGQHTIDLLLWLTAFFVTLFLDVTIGIAVSVALSLFGYMRKILRPSLIVLGRLQGTSCWRNVKRFPDSAQTHPQIAVYRFDAALNFANSSYFEEIMLEQIDAITAGRAPKQAMTAEAKTAPSCGLRRRRKHKNDGGVSEAHACVEAVNAPPSTDHEEQIPTDEAEASGPFRAIILDASSINQLDLTALSTLIRLSERCKQAEICLLFSNWLGPQRDFLSACGFYDNIPASSCFLATVDAYAHALELCDEAQRQSAPESGEKAVKDLTLPLP